MNANNPNLLKAAWDKGIRHFDTAWYYQNGNNEIYVMNADGSNVQRLTNNLTNDEGPTWSPSCK